LTLRVITIGTSARAEHISDARADHGPHSNTQLVWVDDSRTLIPIDQPEVLTDHLHAFLAAHT